MNMFAIVTRQIGKGSANDCLNRSLPLVPFKHMVLRFHPTMRSENDPCRCQRDGVCPQQLDLEGAALP